MNDDYIDIGDVCCPKCESYAYDWENIATYPDVDIWKCTCADCGYVFKVIQESFYKVCDENE